MNGHPDIKRELGRFLRKKREQILPEVYGFSTYRRRTPGLRREEVATLAGVSITWYTWLEQGRADSVSTDILASLADVLRLSSDEQRYMMRLTSRWNRELLSADDHIPPSVQLVLDNSLAPAYAMNRYWTVVRWNAAASVVFGDFAEMTEQDRNLLWFMFLHPQAKSMTANWHAQAEQMVARIHSDYAEYVSDQVFEVLIEDLKRQSELFARLWEAHPVQSRRDSVKHFNHPKVGRLGFIQTTLRLIENPHLKIVIFNPDPSTDTRTKVQSLSQR